MLIVPLNCLLMIVLSIKPSASRAVMWRFRRDENVGRRSPGRLIRFGRRPGLAIRSSAVWSKRGEVVALGEKPPARASRRSRQRSSRNRSGPRNKHVQGLRAAGCDIGLVGYLPCKEVLD